MTFEQWCFDTKKTAAAGWHRDDLLAGWQGAIEAARGVINPLIEFGDHLDYCRTKKEPEKSCDCGRDEAVNDANKFLSEEPR
jgi:hypothetical protein